MAALGPDRPLGDAGQGAHGGAARSAAVDPDVGPVAITRQNVWLDWIEAEQRGWWIEDNLPCHPISFGWFWTDDASDVSRRRAGCQP
jgi:hypothetical protein